MSKLVDRYAPSAQPLHEHFERVASQATRPAPIHALMGERLLDRLEGLRLTPETILDVGAGFGTHAWALHQAFPEARVLALDWSQQMLRHAKKRRGWWRRRFEVVRGDMTTPPIQPGSIDLLFANACLVYAADPGDWMRAMRAVLKPGGFLLVSTFGPDTLARERDQLGVGTSAFMDVQRLGSALTQAGFNEPVLDTDWLTVRYDSIKPLHQDLDEMGWLVGGVAGMDTHTDLSSLEGHEHAPYEVTFEGVYASAFAPDAGQTLSDDGAAIASVPLDQIGLRKRR